MAIGLKMFNVIHRCLKGVDNLFNTPYLRVKLSTGLTRLLASIPSGRAASAARTGGLVLLGGLCLNLAAITVVNADVSKSIDLYKLYAHSRIISNIQYLCLDQLWTRESNWRPNAYNLKGRAYGIPQLRNVRLRGMDAYTQIDLGLKYLRHRYPKGNACEALDHHKAKGWY